MKATEMMGLIESLFPITRSIAGPGVRDSLQILQQIVPLEIKAVPSGSPVLDWTAPKEWHLHEAWIADTRGHRLIDVQQNNLHVVNYSMPTDQQLSLAELKPHLHSLPDQPELIPYRTCYYDDNWGFCVSQRQLDSFGPGPFHVYIDAERQTGELNYGELLISGSSNREILISTHTCHPSLANDNLSGMVLAATLAAQLLEHQAKSASPMALSWRFVFVPGTIGAISWLAQHQRKMPDIAGGLVLTGLGDDQPFTWKNSESETAWIDQIMHLALQQHAPDCHTILPFGPYGYDERQYNSPGFGLPVGRLTRAVHGTFAQYHTSADNLEFVKAEKLQESLEFLGKCAALCNGDIVYRNTCPYGEPQLGRRGLYSSIGARNNPGELQMAMLWMLNQSDGQRSLADIARRSGLPASQLMEVAQLLQENDLLEPVRHALC